MHHIIEKQVVTETLEQKLNIIIMEFNTDQIQKEAEIYRLKNTELKQKNEEIELKAEELRKTNEKLLAITKENEELLKNTLEYDRLKTEFFSTVSHELRTPLNIILSTTQLMALTYIPDSSSDNKLNRYLKMLKQNSYRLLRLIDNLIDINRLDVGYMKMNFRKHNVITIIENVTLSVASYIESKGISLIFDTDIEEKYIVCDADKIERIILNLLSNAVKFTDAHGLIEVNIYDKHDNIIISVKDTGIGIPEEKSKIIFERFRQVDSSLTRKKEGSGIGLSLVKALVEAHGGKIFLKSEVGKGSEFIINLPVRTVESCEHENVVTETTQDVNVERIHIEFSDIYSCDSY